MGRPPYEALGRCSRTSSGILKFQTISGEEDQEEEEEEERRGEDGPLMMKR